MVSRQSNNGVHTTITTPITTTTTTKITTTTTRDENTGLPLTTMVSRQSNNG